MVYQRKTMTPTTTNPTAAQVRAHNNYMVRRAVAMQIWALTSRQDTRTRHSTWNR